MSTRTRDQAPVGQRQWRQSPPPARCELEPSPKRVRAEVGGETIFDTTRALLLLEGDHTPVWYIPMADARMDLMTPTNHATHCPHKGDARYWTLTAGGKTLENAVWNYPTPLSHLDAIADHLAVYFNRLDRWLEEDEEIIGHPAHPFHRIDLRASTRKVVVRHGGTVIAETTAAQFLFETRMPTRFYIPEADIRMDLLTPTDTKSICPYKGVARYWSVTGPGTEATDAAWAYPDPKPEVGRLAGHLCFFAERVDEILVDGAPVARPETRWSKS